MEFGKVYTPPKVPDPEQAGLIRENKLDPLEWFVCFEDDSAGDGLRQPLILDKK